MLIFSIKVRFQTVFRDVCNFRIISTAGFATPRLISSLTHFIPNTIFLEGLRLNPVFPIMFRLCTKRYVIPGTDVVVEKGTPVIIPVFGIQRDPAFYPEPDKFDPDRFSPENLSARYPYSFLTFGEGPRVCIGKTKKFFLNCIVAKYIYN